MLKNNNTYLSLSLTEDTLKIAQIKGSGKTARVTNLFARDIKGYPESDLPKIVQAGLAKFKTKGVIPICVVPLGITSTKNIEIPSTDSSEINSIVSLQASRHTPFARDEIQTGFIKLGTFKNDFTRVLLIIANRKVLREQVSIFEKAGVTIKKVLIAAEGMTSLYSEALNLKSSPTPSGIINIGKESTDFIIAFNGAPLMARSIPVGRSHINQEGPSACDRLAGELHKTIESYQSEDINQMPSGYVVTGTDTFAQTLITNLKQKYQWDVRGVAYEDEVKFANGLLKKVGKNFSENSFLDVIASPVMIESAQVNLLPDEVQLQKSVEAQGKEVFKSALLLIGIFVTLVIAMIARLYMVSSALSDLETQYKEKAQEVAVLNEISETTKTLRDYLDSRMVSLDVIHELYDKIPVEIYITNLTMDETGVISLQGVADSSATVYKWGTPLKESTLFESVEIKSTTAKKDRGVDASAFEISLKVNGN